jgi:hypothetical protein
MAAGDVTYSSASSLTLTSLAGLASTGWWGSAAVDNNTSGAYYLDAFVGGKIVINGTVAANGYIEIYAYGSYDGTTMTAGLNNVSLPDAITWGTNTGVLGYQDLKLLGVASTEATDDGDMVEFGPFSVAQAFGGFLPQKWGVVIRNSTGAALDATGTGNEIKWSGVKIATS